MSFEKILNKSNSYKFYKNNYLSLSEKINDYECELKNLNIELDNLKSDLDIFINRLIENDNDYQFIFSVIIALYNTELYLKDALDSIINQSFPLDKIQIILIDDGSTDNSKKYVKSIWRNILIISYIFIKKIKVRQMLEIMV